MLCSTFVGGRIMRAPKCQEHKETHDQPLINPRRVLSVKQAIHAAWCLDGDFYLLLRAPLNSPPPVLSLTIVT